MKEEFALSALWSWHHRGDSGDREVKKRVWSGLLGKTSKLNPQRESMLSVTCDVQHAEPDIPIGCRADVVESPLRWGEREVQRQSNGMSTARASDRRVPHAETHLGDLSGIGLVPHAKPALTPRGQDRDPASGPTSEMHPNQDCFGKPGRCSKRDSPRATPSMRSFKAHGRIGRPNSATSATVTDSVADQDPEVE
jgi:hypothetical protein